MTRRLVHPLLHPLTAVVGTSETSADERYTAAFGGKSGHWTRIAPGQGRSTAGPSHYQTLRDAFEQEQSSEYACRTAHAIAAISVGD